MKECMKTLLTSWPITENRTNNKQWKSGRLGQFTCHPVSLSNKKPSDHNQEQKKKTHSSPSTDFLSYIFKHLN